LIKNKSLNLKKELIMDGTHAQNVEITRCKIRSFYIEVVETVFQLEVEKR
jgi:hypothetical protein